MSGAEEGDLRTDEPTHKGGEIERLFDPTASIHLITWAHAGPEVADRAGARRIIQGAEQLMRQVTSQAASAAAGAAAAAAADAGAAGASESSTEEVDEGEGDEDEDAWSAAEEAEAPGVEVTHPRPAAAAPGAGGAAFSAAWQAQVARRGLVGALVALAYPDRIAQRRDAGANGGRATFVLSSGGALGPGVGAWVGSGWAGLWGCVYWCALARVW